MNIAAIDYKHCQAYMCDWYGIVEAGNHQTIPYRDYIWEPNL